MHKPSIQTLPRKHVIFSILLLAYIHPMSSVQKQELERQRRQFLIFWPKHFIPFWCQGDAAKMASQKKEYQSILYRAYLQWLGIQMLHSQWSKKEKQSGCGPKSERGLGWTQSRKKRARTWAAAPDLAEWRAMEHWSGWSYIQTLYRMLLLPFGHILLAHSCFGWGSVYSSLNSPKNWADGINWNAHCFHTFGTRWALYLTVSRSASYILSPHHKKNCNTRCLWKHTLSSRHIFDPWAPAEQHSAMMVHMQKSHPFLFLAQDKENLKEDRQWKILRWCV